MNCGVIEVPLGRGRSSSGGGWGGCLGGGVRGGRRGGLTRGRGERSV